MARKNAKGNNDEEVAEKGDDDNVEKIEGDQLKIDDKEEEILIES